ncbi:rhombotarget A [Acinetobacter sp. ANC 4470]|uniref:rhombotarget A n=1 Tax=Acinetobacter sp. ANC 4470 TaxID=1977881 RepID=UPI000A3599AF|nr:rhombotarget A [Acinetobacter sp. ANC 4470]OTG68169.1 rhombotarget A [Acinetobacter sp. ANC 4470]
MLKRSIGIGMLCIAGHAYSGEIKVTTTEDVSKDDTECSLREAIEYVNRDFVDSGYQGCVGRIKDTGSTLLLGSKLTYKLNTHIKISAPLHLRTVYDDTTGFDKPVAGVNNAIIKMLAKDNIFVIDDTKKEVFTIKMTEVSLQGCNQSVCADKGGLIYNNEFLTLEYVKLSGGSAKQGGAIYNVAVPAADKDATERSLVDIKSSLFEKNTADEGAILYSQVPRFRISNSVFRENETTLTTSANIYSAKSLDDAEIAAFPLMIFKVAGSTFYKNKGFIINVLDGIGLNNLTVVGNSAGIQFNAPLKKAYLANSIVLGNPYPVTQDNNCTFVAGDKSFIQNNLVANSCTSGDSNYPNDIWSGTQLIAGDSLEGKCKTLSEDKNALLCPYVQSDATFLGYFRPRILMSYQGLSDSLIVNKGRLQLNVDAPLMGCEAADQRDQNRDSDNIFCDRGAIEIIVPSTTGLVGKDLLIGEIAKISLTEYLSDSDLVPKEECEAILGKNPTGEAWQAGCMQVIQTQTASKGKLTIDEEGNLVYTPQGTWHGADLFKIRLVTSSTRFNKTRPYMEVNVHVVQEPKNDMESSTVSTSGGSFGFFSIFTILGLVGLRRYKNKQG